MEFLRHVVRGVLHPHVRTQQGVVHAAFQRQSVGELLAHGDAEAQRLVVAERTLAVSAAAQGRQAVAVADHRRSIVLYRGVEHPGSQTFAVSARHAAAGKQGERRLFMRFGVGYERLVGEPRTTGRAGRRPRCGPPGSLLRNPFAGSLRLRSISR